MRPRKEPLAGIAPVRAGRLPGIRPSVPSCGKPAVPAMPCRVRARLRSCGLRRLCPGCRAGALRNGFARSCRRTSPAARWVWLSARSCAALRRYSGSVPVLCRRRPACRRPFPGFPDCPGRVCGGFCGGGPLWGSPLELCPAQAVPARIGPRRVVPVQAVRLRGVRSPVLVGGTPPAAPSLLLAVPVPERTLPGDVPQPFCPGCRPVSARPFPGRLRPGRSAAAGGRARRFGGHPLSAGCGRCGLPLPPGGRILHLSRAVRLLLLPDDPCGGPCRRFVGCRSGRSCPQAQSRRPFAPSDGDGSRTV